jgi:hypothetical protein
MYQLYTYKQRITPGFRENFLTMMRKLFEEKISADLKVNIESLELRGDNRLEIKLKGERKDDETFAASLIKEIVGETILLKDLKAKQVLKGICRSVGSVGFGLFVDIGLQNPSKEVLVPLYELRKQLVNEQTISTPEIIHKYGFIDNLPVEVEIVRIDTSNPDRPQIDARFSENYINQMKTWVQKGENIVFTVGAPRKVVKEIVARTGHTLDVPEIQRLGPLETALFCKEGSYAPGIISEIGPSMSNVKLSMLIPAQVRRFWS